MTNDLIYHIFYPITDISPLKLVVTLKGEAKKAQSSRAGIYVLATEMVNGKSHWLQDTGDSAIWYDKENKDWNIGLQNEVGSPIPAGLYTNEDVAGPQKATTWKYLDDGKWLTSDNGTSVDTFVETGTYSKAITLVQKTFCCFFVNEKNQGGSYEVSFFPALWMVSSESWKRGCPN